MLTCLFHAPLRAESAPLLPWLKADRIEVEKSRRILTIYKGGELLKTYDIAMGLRPAGRKEQEGDERTPEGHYIIEGRNPRSRFYKSLRISYPNAEDRARAVRLGVDPGGEIMIHGLSPRMEPKGRYHRFYNWTNGCIAVTNSEMDELWRAVDDGTPIHIKP